jgi:hypothetical protein
MSETRSLFCEPPCSASTIYIPFSILSIVTSLHEDFTLNSLEIAKRQAEIPRTAGLGMRTHAQMNKYRALT